jgi:hypothetical protein
MQSKKDASASFLLSVSDCVENSIRKDENSSSTDGRAWGGLVTCPQAGSAGSLTPGKPGYR